jgi:hypothetical protein
MTTTPNHSNGQQIQTKSSQQEIVGSKRWNQSTSSTQSSTSAGRSFVIAAIFEPSTMTNIFSATSGPALPGNKTHLPNMAVRRSLAIALTP